MSMRDDFLDEIQEGDYVEITYGLQGSQTVAGIVLKITSSMVRLQCTDRSPRIALDSIILYDTPEPPPVFAAVMKQTSQSAAGASTAGSQSAAGALAAGSQPGAGASAAGSQSGAGASAAGSQPAAGALAAGSQSAPGALAAGSRPAPEPVPAAPEPEEVRQLQALCRNSTRPDDDSIANWDNVLQDIRESCTQQVRSRAISIADGFQAVQKQLSQSGSSRDTEHKIHDLRARVLTLIQQNPDDSEYLYPLLGSMCFQLRDYDTAAYAFAAGQDFEGAYYAASCSEKNDNCPAYLEAYIREDRNIAGQLLFLYAQQAARRKDVSALRERYKILHEHRSELDPRDAEDLRMLLSCASVLSSEAGLPQDWLTGTTAQPPLDRLDAFFRALPNGWVTEGKPLRASAPEWIDKNEEIVSTISAFYHDKCIGFLHEPGGDCFFHIKQVMPEGPLRAMLAAGKSIGLEVSYRHGINFDGQRAATNITLTDAGAAEAARRMENENRKYNRLTGTLDTYDGQGDLYWINTKEGRGYSLKWESITDPYLRIYLRVNFSFRARVEFDLRRLPNGKDAADNVCFAGDGEPLSETDVNQGIRDGAATREELEVWPELKKQFAARQVDLFVGASAYFADFPYLELPAWDPAHSFSAAPAPKAALSPAPPLRLEPAPSLPPLEPLPPHTNRFRQLPARRSNLREGELYERAHTMTLQGNLAKAEEYYLYSIQARERLELCVSGLSSLYLRDESRLLDAIDLLETYGDCLDEDKRRNQEISVYQKGKTRPFQIKLCHLLENGLHKAPRTSVRMHYLMLQGNILRQLGEHEMALNSYARWRKLYEHEVQCQGQVAAQKLAVALYSIKRGEALCQYFLGRKEQAAALAGELLRINPADATALQIRDGTLEESDTSAPSAAPAAPEDTFEAAYELGSATLCRYLSDRLDSLDTAALPNPAHIENGRYTGTPEDAQQEIARCSRQPGGVDGLLCAAWIAREMAGQLAPGAPEQERRLAEAREMRYLGSAMAAYGDAMLSKALQQDTSRFAYLQVLLLTNERHRSWPNALNRYLLSFFMDPWQLASLPEEDSPREDLFSRNAGSRSVSVGELTVGLLPLLRVLRRRSPALCGKLTEDLHRSGLPVEQWLAEYGIACGSGDAAGFAEALEKADRRLAEAEQRLSEAMAAAPQVHSWEGCSRILGLLSDPDDPDWFIPTDRERLEKLCRLLESLKRYHLSDNFRTCSDILAEADQGLAALASAIRAYPTQVSYDCFLPALDAMRSGVAAMVDSLYGQNPPMVELVQAVPAYIDEERNIRVSLSVRNRGTGRQRAEEPELRVRAVDSGLVLLDGAGPLEGIDGNSECRVLLRFCMAEQMLGASAFHLVVECSYQYRVSAAEKAQGTAVLDDFILLSHEPCE